MFRKLALLLATAAVGASPVAISKLAGKAGEVATGIPAISIDTEANKEKIGRLLNDAVALAKSGQGNEATHKAVLCGLGSLGYENGSLFINNFLASQALSPDLNAEVKQQILSAREIIQVDAARLSQDVARWCSSI